MVGIFVSLRGFLRTHLHSIVMIFDVEVKNYINKVSNMASAPIPGNPNKQEVDIENSFKGIFIPV